MLTWWFSQQGAYASLAFYALAIFCNQPHYMATVYRAYHTKEDFNKYRFFTVYITVLLAATVLLVHFAPSLFPYVFTLYLTWSPWHYTGQNYGIAMMLIRRTGAQPTDEDRSLLWWSYIASYVVWFVALHSSKESAPTLVLLGINPGVASWIELFCIILFFAAGAYGLARIAKQVGWRKLIGPILLHLSQSLWFVSPTLLKLAGGFDLPATYFSAGILAFMHCAQYLWITTFYARREGSASTGAGTEREKTNSAPGFSFWRYYAGLVVGGIALFIPGPWIASRIFHYDLVESFFIFMALVNLHHFILDGAIWKLRDGRIARLLLGRNPSATEAEQALETTPASSHLGWLFGPTRTARKLRWTLAVVIVVIGLADQAQYALTLKSSDPSALAIAHNT